MSSDDDENSRLLPAIPNTSFNYGLGSEIEGMNNLSMNQGGDQKTKRVPQYIAALAATGGALAAGAALGWTSPSSSRLVKDQEYNFTITEDEFSWVGAALTLGAAPVCILTGFLINMIGRKPSMLLLIVPFCLGWGLIIFAQNLAMLIVGRVFLGVSSGAFCVAAPLYIGEIAQKEIRGTLGTFFQLMITIGILFVYAVGAGVNVFWLSIICGIIPLIFGVVFMFMPESPAYLVINDKSDAARNAYKWLRGNNFDSTEEIAEIQNEEEERKANNLSTKEALSRPASKRALVISFGLMFFQQMSGINAVIFYTTDIFNAANTGIDPEKATIIVGVMQVVATFISSLVVDRLGRRILLLLSSTVMAICTLLMGIYFFMQDKDKTSVESLGWLPVTALCIFIITFSLGFGPVPWLMLGEVFASDIKGFAGSLSGTLNWSLAFIVTKSFSNLVTAIKIGPTFWLFSVLTVLGGVFVFMLVPETKGKSLNEIQKMLSGEKVTNETEQKN